MNGARRLVGLILVGLAAPFLPASGALAAGPVDPQPQIVNGLATSDWPDVAYLATGIGFCSATFIGCRTVLTAAHCVCDSGGTGPACPDGTFLLDPLPMFVFLQHAGFTYVVTDVRVEPNYSFAFAGDAAVLELLYPLRGIRPSPINTLDDPSFGTAGTVVGFGRTSDSASDAGVKRWGSVITSSCSGAGVPNSTHACWSFDPPVGPPGSDSNICFGDSGGPLFADVGAGATIVGIHSGAAAGCTAPTDAFDTDVFAVHSWIEAEAGADLDNTQCGDGFQVGDVQVTTWGASGSVSGQAFHSFAVPPGTKLLNLGLNAELGNPPNNFDLYLKFGAPPSVGDFDCSSTFLGSLESCEIPDPAAGSWHVLVDAVAGSGDYQVNAALFPSNPDPPGLAPGEIVVTDFVGWELMQVDRSSGDRAVTSSPVRGTGPGLASPEGMSTDGTGAIAVANLSRSNVIRIDPTTGDRSLISGCVDFGCTSRLGAGPDFLGPRSVALQTDHRLIVTDRSIPPVSAVVRVDPASGDRTLLSGCADPSCSGVVGGGPLFDRVLGASVEPGGAILVADSFAVLRVDPDTGDRSVLSGCADVSCTSQVGTGPGFGDPFDVAVDYTGDILVTDSSPGSAFRAIFRVDPGTGARTVLSGCANSSCSALVGSGSNFSDGLAGIGVDPSGDIWVADREFEAVFHVDPMTGNRTIASGCIDAGCTTLAGVGTQFTLPLDVIVLPEPDQWLSLTTAVAFLAVLGLPRGVRASPLTRTSRGEIRPGRGAAPQRPLPSAAGPSRLQAAWAGPDRACTRADTSRRVAMAEREQWDAIVIGSGLGGLTCAAYLSVLGRRTLVLEAHYVAGGNSQAFRRDLAGREFEFDVGVHYIGECGPDGLITRMLNGLGLAERVVFRPLDPDGYSTLYFPGLTFRVPASWDSYRARLLETFPSEREALGRTVDTLREVAEAGRRFQRGELTIENMAEQAPAFLQWGLRPVTDLFAEHRISEQASAVLLGEQGDYAVRPSHTPAALAAGLTDHYMRGAFYPEGGGQAMAGRLVEAIRAFGGEVRTRAPVERVRVKDGRAVGVVLGKNGAEIDAPVVVSNADLKRTVLELVGVEHFSAEIVERVRAFRMTLPLFAVYAGLDLDLRSEGLPNTNHWIWGTTDIEGIYDRVEKGELPNENLAYLTITSLRDPESRQVAPQGYTNLQVMTLVPPDYDVWNVERGPAEGGRYHRDPEYRRRKQALMDSLLEQAEAIVPGLREHVCWKEAATPVTQERFTHSTGGTSYGIECATDQMGPARMGYATEVEGLFLCGASTPAGHGIANVMFSGLRAAEAAAGCELRGDVLAGKVLGDHALLPPLRDDWDAWRESH